MFRASARPFKGANVVTVAPPLQRRLQPSATDTAFRVFVSDVSRGIRYLVDRLTEGDLTPAEWEQRMLEQLTAAHAQAGYRGRLRAGDTAPYDADDTRFGALVAQEEQPFLSRFRADIEGGRYGVEEPDTEALQRRAAMYTAKLYATATEAWGLTLDEPLWWRLGEAEESCRSCVRLAEGSPYAPGTLRVGPRSGATSCKVFCKCFVETRGGQRGFAP
jgi:hypothetical protein